MGLRVLPVVSRAFRKPEIFLGEFTQVADIRWYLAFEHIQADSFR